METYLLSEFAKLNTKSVLEPIRMEGGLPWVEDYKHYNYQAAKNATEVSTLETMIFKQLAFRKLEWATLRFQQSALIHMITGCLAQDPRFVP